MKEGISFILESFKEIKTLVVDDEELIRWSLQNALKNEGFSVELASSVDDALELLEKSEYDIVITDYKMPGLSGLELLDKIREKGISPIVIVISAYLSHSTVKEANEKGVFRCVGKPFGIEDFIKVVKEAAKKRITNN
jgi:DNA-binding NtrC family response regulator